MILFASDARSLLSRLWDAFALPEDESTSTSMPLAIENGDEQPHDPDRIADQEAIYLAILNGPVPF
jgi:hypothetical protein